MSATPSAGSVSAQSLVERVAALPGARRSAVREPLVEAAVVADVEIAYAKVGDEGALRRAWRDRHRGGATPLVLLSDEFTPAGQVAVIGPTEHTQALRQVDGERLFELVRGIAGVPRLHAVRELTGELERLDEAGIPGLKVRELLTNHTLDVRLRRDEQRWHHLAEQAAAVPEGAEWQDALRALGYDLERRSDYGWLARHNNRPVAVIHPKQDPGAFSRLDKEGRPPEGALVNDCAAEGASYGLLAAGTRLRLIVADPEEGSAVSGFLELDTGALRAEDRPLLGLLGPPYLVEDGFAELQRDAREFGSKLQRRVDQRLRHQVLPALAAAFKRWADEQGLDTEDDEVRGEMEHAALNLVFRALFIQYAEASNYLPMDHSAYHHASLTSLVEEAHEYGDQLDPRSTSLWDRFVALVKALRTGDTARGVPAYNGALFAADGFEGAELLERMDIHNDDFGAVLVGFGRDDQGRGLDYSTLEIGHLGNIYEGLLALWLSAADRPLRYDPRADRYVTVDEEEAEVLPGELLWQTHEGGRKRGGVYYTRPELVRHLVRQAVAAPYQHHLERVRERAETDRAAAAEALFDFSVLDPACGSAHFLVVVVDELADHMVRFLAETPLLGIRDALDSLQQGAPASVPADDVALLRRLIVKRCVYGVDLSPMGAEIAKMSLWLASFVPGLSLAYLDRNVQVGNSLVGVARPEVLQRDTGEQLGFLEEHLQTALDEAAGAVARVAATEDRTPDEITASLEADHEARQATRGLKRVFDLWTAEPFGVEYARPGADGSEPGDENFEGLEQARQEVELRGPDVISGARNELADKAERLSREHRFLHWPLAFPTVFSGDRGGFDAVIGNPPWEEVTVEEQSFYALFRPGIRRGIPEVERDAAVQQLLRERPELEERLEREKRQVEVQRAYLNREFPSTAGDPDLYKAFCRRYRDLVREEGHLGIVLPRNVFVTQGSEEFRRWLFESNQPERLDFIENRSLWMFDTHAQSTVALVTAQRRIPLSDHHVRIAGTSRSLTEWEQQAASRGIALSQEAFGPGWTIPLLREQAEAELLAKLRRGTSFAYGGGRWRCFPVRELDETNQKYLWREAEAGWPLWKGEGFDQYAPHGAEARVCPPTEEAMKKALKPRPGSKSLLAAEVLASARQQAQHREVGQARVAFRDVTQKTNSRTVLACLVPPQVLLTNSAPYLAFLEDDDQRRAACLAVMNSLPFDWQARRFVETHVNFFILEGLVVPELDQDSFEAIAAAAARLSCVDDRFADFAASVGVDVGPLTEEQRSELQAEIDARVADAWGLAPSELDVLFADFTEEAVPKDYRERVAARLGDLHNGRGAA